MRATGIGLGAALSLISCHAATAQDRHILSPLQGEADNSLVGELQSRDPGTLCSIAFEGHAVLMSYGNEAVVDVDSVPTLLSYRPDAGDEGAAFVGNGITVRGKLQRENVTDLANTVSHDVNVQVQSGRLVERFPATWTCQAELMTVRAKH